MNTVRLVQQLAVMLECDLDVPRMERVGIAVERSSSENRFGVVRVSRLSKDEASLLVYEQDSAVDGRSFADLHLPLYADLFLRRIKNVVLLGFGGGLTPDLITGTFVVPEDVLD